MPKLELTTTVDCVTNNVIVERKIQKILVHEDDKGNEYEKIVKTNTIYFCPKDKNGVPVLN